MVSVLMPIIAGVVVEAIEFEGGCFCGVVCCLVGNDGDIFVAIIVKIRCKHCRWNKRVNAYHLDDVGAQKVEEHQEYEHIYLPHGDSELVKYGVDAEKSKWENISKKDDVFSPGPLVSIRVDFQLFVIEHK